MTVAEAVQQKGVDGVPLVKRWLESSTWIELPYDAYTGTQMCTRLDGKEKRFDLQGSLFTTPTTPLYVEVKDYDTPSSKQAKEYWTFLSNATARDLRSASGDGRREFMWVTRHPFATTDWADLTTAKRIEKGARTGPGCARRRPRQT